MNDRGDKWLKAAVIGSLWGASEIVLGSFLHNLRVPFSGNILTAIGIVLMVSGHRLWPQAGILIRSGLVCAALKTLSPSPVILGPMLSIVMQASLMETALFLSRGTKAGYLIGGGLAVIWNLLYRILSSIVLYGSSLITLYQNLIDHFTGLAGLETQNYWWPLLLLWALFFLWGSIAGVAGIYISNRAKNVKPSFNFTLPVKDPASGKDKFIVRSGMLTRIRPVIAFVLLLAGLYSISVFPLGITIAVTGVLLMVLYLYEKSIISRLFKKRALWVAMAIMLVLSGFFLGQQAGFSLEGFTGGIEMVLRAIYVIGGFGLISSELQRPEVSAVMKGKALSPLMDAVRVAFHTTPVLIETLPQGREWRKPARVLASMAGSMEHSLELMKRQNRVNRKTFIISGKQGEGKTTLANRVNKILKESKVITGGIIAPAYRIKGHRAGYMLESAGEAGKSVPLCHESDNLKEHLPGRFVFDEKGIEYGEELLSEAGSRDCDLVIIDEIGPYELKGMGWDKAFEKLLNSCGCNLLIVVRESLTDIITDRYGLHKPVIIKVSECSAEQAAEIIKKEIGKSGV